MRLSITDIGDQGALRHAIQSKTSGVPRLAFRGKRDRGLCWAVLSICLGCSPALISVRMFQIVTAAIGTLTVSQRPRTSSRHSAGTDSNRPKVAVGVASSR
jgi:hypothetical protein